ncbi:dihydrofolate reductase [Pelagibius litoralis]|uniref:Dihydrofolate reductase n=1 Tax=Pelagibius litoralis TaxID=374515 RepID=A0A967C1W6_9PROT|nr:dihydrofolate reductase [Pelagibius litoralis]
MTTGHVYIAVSLDGFIAAPDGGLDWLMKQPTEGEDHGYDDFMDSVDGLVMGRATYEKVLTFGAWPYAKPVVVLSRSLAARDLREDLVGKVRIVGDSPKQVMDALSKEGWRRAYIDGGQLIQAFLRENLISDLVLTRIPILLGSGIPLFGRLDEAVDLKHVKTVDYPSGLVQSTYQVIRPASPESPLPSSG